jgi:hypothetical protein
MTTKWEELVALASEIDRARRSGSIIAPERAGRLVREVLWLDQARRVSQPQTVDAHRRHG